MTSASIFYALFYYTSSSQDPPESKRKNDAAIKSEPEEGKQALYNPLSVSDLSETPRTFPSLGRGLPLQFSGRPAEEETKIKKEEDIEPKPATQPLAGEADDEGEGDSEDEGTASWRDSGIGTGRESSDKKGLRGRRKSSYSG